MNGAAANGTTHVGIYTEDGTRIVTKSATQAGTNTLQVFDLDETILAPATYYMALGNTSTLASFFRVAPGTVVSKALGCAQQASAVPLPAIATMAAFAQNYIPLFGVVFGLVA
jgi:hypothetical protein